MFFTEAAAYLGLAKMRRVLTDVLCAASGPLCHVLGVEGFFGNAKSGAIRALRAIHKKFAL